MPNQNQEVLITFSYVLPATISFVYILGMSARFYELQSDIIAEPIQFSYAIIFRITLLILDIAAEFTEFLLVIFYSESSNPYISSVLFINISAIIMQIFLMIYEYKKQVPMFFAHKVYWILNWIALDILMVLLIIYSGTTLADLLTLFRIVIYTILLIFTLFIRKQDIATFEDLGFWRSALPDSNSFQLNRSDRVSTVNFPIGSQFLKIEVKKRWNIIDEQVEIKLEISITGINKSIKLKRTIAQMFQMHDQLVIEQQEYFDIHQNELMQLNFLIKQIEVSQDLSIITYTQKYLNILVAIPDLIGETFLDFLDLTNDDKQFLNDIKQTRKTSNINLNKSSIAIKPNQLSIQSTQKKWDVQEQYLTYMDIRITDRQQIKQEGETYIQYTIVTQFEDEHSLVQKRFKECYDFYEAFKQQSGIKVFPPFPQKSLIRMSEDELDERQKDLEIFLRILLNDRQYHQTILFKFLGISQQLEIRIKQKQQVVIKESELITQLQIKNIGYEEVLDKDNDKFVKYSFQIGVGHLKHIIWKRFNQFDELNSLLKLRYTILPQLPYQFTALLQQISPSLRCVNLQQYLQDLIKVPTIGENIHFRQFLEIKNILNYIEDTQISNGSQTQLEIIFEKLDHSNSDIEKLENMRGRLWQ